MFLLYKNYIIKGVTFYKLTNVPPTPEIKFLITLTSPFTSPFDSSEIFQLTFLAFIKDVLL